MAVTVRIRFEPSGIELDGAVGERLLDIADEHLELGLPSACRAGNCGACLLRVATGSNVLTAPARTERRARAELKASDDQRLGCQMSLRSDLEPGDWRTVLVFNQA